MGAWMKINGESIYGTQASPFKQLDWGRCTQKSIDGETKLYLHVFDWPQDGKLSLPGLSNPGKQAYLLSDATKKKLAISRSEDALVINVPAPAPDADNSVVVLELAEKTLVIHPPIIAREQEIFMDAVELPIYSDPKDKDLEIRYTLDGSAPSSSSPRVDKAIRLTNTTLVSARVFRKGQPASAASAVAQAKFTKVDPVPAASVDGLTGGVKYKYFEGGWDKLPDFSALMPVEEGVQPEVSLSPRKSHNLYGFEFSGYVKIPADGVYAFYTESDDGSRLYIGDQMVVDNDGLHAMAEKHGLIALSAGFHPIRIAFFEKTGGDDLKVFIKGEREEKKQIPGSILFYKEDRK